jgi:hypothetical protein
MFKNMFIVASVFSSSVFSQSDVIDESALFSDTVSIVDNSKLIDHSLTDSSKSTAVIFSGAITSAAEAGFSNDYFNHLNRKEITPSAYIVGNGFLDVRLPLDMKALANLQSISRADTLTPDFSIRELFVDANINKHVYFRTGKQLLQWGVCNFWNPTDLISIDRKKFIENVGSREGVYGFKVDIPYKTLFNFCGFVDMDNLKSVDSISGAAKFEFLVKGTEIGTCVWGKRNKKPVFGVTVSTAVKNFNINAEANVTSGNNYLLPDWNDGSLEEYLFVKHAPVKDLGNIPVTRVCLSVFRFFDLLDIKDRVSVDIEAYYNQAGEGSGHNFFKDHNIGSLLENLPDNEKYAANMAVYRFLEPNSYSMFYTAFFASVSKFIISDLTLNINGIMNLNQSCAVLSTGLSYRNLHGFSIGLMVNNIIGSEETEYTLYGNRMSTRLTAGLVF